MALIDVDTPIFDPESRPQAIAEVAALIGVDVEQDGIDIAAHLLTVASPTKPEDVADYLDTLGRMAGVLVCAAIVAITGQQALEARVAELEARVTTLED